MSTLFDGSRHGSGFDVPTGRLRLSKHAVTVRQVTGAEPGKTTPGHTYRTGRDQPHRDHLEISRNPVNPANSHAVAA